MSPEQLRELLTASQVDFKEFVPTVEDAATLTALHAILVSEGSNRLTDFGIDVLDRELARRG